MINNIIRITRQEMDRLKLMVKQKDFRMAAFNIATQGKFPLHEIHFVFKNIHPGEIWEIDTTIQSVVASPVFKNVVYCNGRFLGVVNVTMKDFKPMSLDWCMDFEYLAIREDKEQWLMDVGSMAVFATMMVSYAMLYSNQVFEATSTGKHRLKAVKSPSGSDEIIYRKLNALMSVRHSAQSTGKGTPPRHEFDVRGHMRRCKSGKLAYIRPYTKCKGRGERIIHEYSVSGGDVPERRDSVTK